jgi:TraM recognition site of TraD and TraG
MNSDTLAVDPLFPLSGHSATDRLSCLNSQGKTIRLLTKPGSDPTILDQCGDFTILAQFIGTAPPGATDGQSSRFTVRIRNGAGCVYSRTWSTEQKSLSGALQIAQKWIAVQRQTDRILFVFSPPLLLLWLFCLSGAWFLFPLIGWSALLPPAVAFPLALIFAPRRQTPKISARLGGQIWDRNDFCRGWLITGDTGSGKTFAVNALLHSVFQHEPDWGGLCCDEKGIYHETLVRMARHYGRECDLLLLQTRPDHAQEDWIPAARFNLLSDPTIPHSTYATVIVDTAAALMSGHEDKGFFKTQAHANIGRGIQLFRLLNLRPTMHHLLEMLQYQQVLRAMLQELEPKKSAGDPDARDCYEHFLNGFLRQPPEQLGGVISTIYNYLNYFTNPDVIQVFGTEENTFDFSALDRGAIICLSMPQKYQTERRYITTILKLLFYTHALRRFDPRGESQRQVEDDNLLICWQDEAQRFVTESDGNVDVLRQSRTTTVMAAQSKISFFPVLGGREKAEVTILNLRNRIIFKAADRTCAETSADFLGRHLFWKKSFTRGKGGSSTTRSREEEYLVKPHELMNLPKFTAIIKHCERPFVRRRIHPLDPEGRTPRWYSCWR